MKRIELWPQFEAMAQVPTLAIRGENSDILSAETLEEMTRRRPLCESWVVPGQGHAPLLTDSITIERIRTFVERVG
jgi:pimeloyl-ACP methyl ester carboxylesterase